MKRSYAMVTIGALLMAVSHSVYAEKTNSSYYYSIEPTIVLYDVAELDDTDASHSAIYGRVGRSFNKYLAVEVRAGIGTTSGTASTSGVDLDVQVELEYLAGAYARVGWPLLPSIYLYAVGGYAQISLEAYTQVQGLNVGVSETESNISFGVGGEVRLTKNWYLNVELTRYHEEIDALSVGVTRYIGKK